jgi:hypothetical protein
MMRLNAQFCYCITMTVCITDRHCLLLHTFKTFLISFHLSVAWIYHIMLLVYGITHNAKCFIQLIR